MRGNICWGCGVVPWCDRIVNEEDESWQTVGVNGWCNEGLTHGNDLPDVNMHNRVVEIEIKNGHAFGGPQLQVCLYLDGALESTQELEVPLEDFPTIVISGNNGTEVMFQSPQDFATMGVDPQSLPGASQMAANPFAAAPASGGLFGAAPAQPAAPFGAAPAGGGGLFGRRARRRRRQLWRSDGCQLGGAGSHRSGRRRRPLRRRRARAAAASERRSVRCHACHLLCCWHLGAACWPSATSTRRRSVRRHARHLVWCPRRCRLRRSRWRQLRPARRRRLRCARGQWLRLWCSRHVRRCHGQNGNRSSRRADELRRSRRGRRSHGHPRWLWCYCGGRR